MNEREERRDRGAGEYKSRLELNTILQIFIKA